MRKITAILSLLLTLSSSSQNLVPNPSFEQYDSCPQYSADFFCTPWYNPTDNTPDYFNECWTGTWYDSPDVPINRWGSEPAHSGSAYSGIATKYSSANGREYITVKLLDTLNVGSIYNVELYVTLADSSKGGTNLLGIHFSTTPDTMYAGFNIYYLPFVPQIEFDTLLIDTANWVRFSASFIASGNECYMTIGVFRPDSLLDYQVIQGDSSITLAEYFIDDVSVVEYQPPVYSEILLFPNPNDGNFTINGNFPLGSELKIYNMLGQQVSNTISLPEGNANVPINSFLAQGVYYCRIDAEGILLKEERLVVVE